MCGRNQPAGLRKIDGWGLLHKIDRWDMDFTSVHRYSLLGSQFPAIPAFQAVVWALQGESECPGIDDLLVECPRSIIESDGLERRSVAASRMSIPAPGYDFSNSLL
jgi:hypothetical protein